ncbi:MAG: hypothetical protein JWQ02_2434, partial [Capsulimonas sp.]|nr:hypothetical protein [Capsulimonas sp.]
MSGKRPIFKAIVKMLILMAIGFPLTPANAAGVIAGKRTRISTIYPDDAVVNIAYVSDPKTL